MLELEKLVFEVDTTQLQKAEQHLLDLGVAVQKVNRPVNETAKSTENLGKQSEKAAKLLQREADALEFMNKGFSRGHASRLAYAKSLGISTKALEENLKAQAALTNSKYMDRMARDADAASKSIQKSVDHITRALGPQLTDVFVGLATGQSPFMILAQQGGQISDQLQLAGVAGKNMSKQLVDAAKITLENYVNVGKAIGGLFVQGFIQAGAAANNLFLEMTGLNAVIAKTQALVSTESFLKLKAVLTAVSAGAVALGTAMLALGVVSLYKTMTVTSELNKVMVLNGNAFGMSRQQAIEYADSLDTARVSSFAVVEVMTEMAKAGGFTASHIEMVTQAATDMKDYGGVAIEDTVKKFSEMGKDPVKALTEFASKTGLVTQAQIQQVQAAVKQGDQAKAVTLAMQAGAKAMDVMSSRLQDQLHPLEKVLLGWKLLGRTLWDISNFGSSSEIQKLGELRAALTEAEGKYGSDSLAVQVARKRVKEQEELVRLSALKNSKENENKKLAEDALKIDEMRSEIAKDMNRANADTMSKQAFIDAKLRELRKEKGVGADAFLPLDVVKSAFKTYGDEWDKAQKKVKKDNSLEKYYDKITEKVRDLGNTVNVEYDEMFGSVSGLTKAEKERLDILDDKKWKQLDAASKARVLQDLSEIITKEKLIEVEKKHSAVSKILYDTSVAYTKQQEDSYKTVFDLYKKNDEIIKEQNAEIAFQESLLGKTTEQADKLTEAHERAKKELAIQKQYEQDILAIKTAAWNLAGQNEANIDYDRMNADIAALEKNRANQIDNLNKESAIKTAKAYLDEFNKISSGITDSIVTALFEGGKAGRKKLRDMLVEAIRKPITTYVNVVVNEIMGAGLSMLLSAAGLSNNGSTASNALNAISGANSAYNIYNTGVGGSIGSSVNALGNIAGSAGTSAFGTGMTLSGASAATAANAYTAASVDAYMMGDIAAGAQYGQVASGLQTGSTAGGYASSAGGYAAGAVAGHYAGRAISNGYSAMGGSSGNTAVNLGTAIGAVIAGPIGAAIGGALGGLTNRAFGSKTSTGIQGTFSGSSGFQGQEYTDTSYGLLRFRGDRTSTSALDESDRQAIANDFNLLKSSILETAENLGIASNALDDFRSTVRFTTANASEYEGMLKSLNEDMATELLTSLLTVDASKEVDGARQFTGQDTITAGEFQKIIQDWKFDLKSDATSQVNRDWVGQVYTDALKLLFKEEIAEFQRDGESVSDTFNRISKTLGNTNQVFEDLGWKLNEFSLAGYSAAENFIAALGGLDAANSKLSKYYQNFYSEQERVTNYIEKGTDAFAKLGITFPKSMSEFRTLVTEQQKLGNTQVVADLMNLQDYVIGSYAQMSDGIIEEVNRIRNIAAADSKGNSLSVLMAQFNKSGSVEDSKALLDFAESNVGSLLELQRLRAGVINKLLGNSDMQAAAPEVLNSAPVASSSAGSSISESVTNSSSDLQAVVEALKEEIVNLRYEMQANVSWTSKTAKILERVTPDGDAIATRVAT